MPQLSCWTLTFLLLASVCFGQSSAIQVGQGATTATIGDEFRIAYQRGDFISLVALPPLTEVVAYGIGGFRQEFQDAARTGIKYALVRPANPDLTQGLNNAVLQVRPPIYAVYTLSSIGVSNAGFPTTDTLRLFAPVSGPTGKTVGLFYQLFDKGFGIFVWDSPPLEGGSDTRFLMDEPISSKWKSISIDALGPPLISATAVVSRFTTKANYQLFPNGAIYAITSGAQNGRVIFLRKNVQDLYTESQGPQGFLGLPLGEETVLAGGRRRQTFEGGTMDYAINGVPVLKNALQTVRISNLDPIRLTAGQNVTLNASLLTIAGETVTDRDVFWSTTNGRVATITGTGAAVTLRAVAGGTAIITATSEGKSSNRITVFVASQCCAIGEGAPTQATSQTFVDAIQRNRVVVRLPVSTPVRRVGAGFLQEAISLPSGNRVWIAKADISPVAYVILSPLLGSIEALGGVAGVLGYPLSDVSAGGTQRFENGSLAGLPSRIVSGAIQTRWLALGAEFGLVGLPVAERISSITLAGATVLSQQFRSGVLYEFASGSLLGRTFLTSGLIGAKHAELGFAGGSIGAPITNEFLLAGAVRQEFEGAFLEYSAGGPVRVIDKERRPTLTVIPSAILPGGRYRVVISGFAANSRLRLTQGSGTTADSFDISTPNGSFIWESTVPTNARAGVVILRATNSNAPQTFVEGNYTVRTLAELRPTLSKLSGDSQASTPATIAPLPIRVLVRDSTGNPIPGVALRFEASPGGGIVGASVQTGPDGVGEARFRLPAQSGVALVSVEAGGQIVAFSARAAEQVPTDFPRISQAVSGNLGSSSSPLSDKGSLVASLAAVIRFYQQRGVVPVDNGLADTVTLNSYLQGFCATDAAGAPLCDGYLNAGTGTDLQPNLFRSIDFSQGILSPTFLEPNLSSIREGVANSGPVVVGLDVQRNGQPTGVHFVTAYGVYADGDLAISDPNPQVGFTRLSQYTNGFPAAGAVWRASSIAAILLSPRAAATPAFYAWSTSMFGLNSPGAACSRFLQWPATFSSPTSTADSTMVRFQSCDGTAANYQLSTTASPFLVSVVSLTNPPAQSIVSGVDPAAYRVSRSQTDSWILTPEQLTLNTAAILNAANFQPRLGVGTIISIFGNGLPLAASASSTVELNGQALPIFFSNGFQLNTAIPADILSGPATLTLRSPFGDASATIEVLDQSPAIFTMDGRGSAAALNQDSSLNHASNPATRGQAIVLYCTGLGSVTRQSNGLSTTRSPVTVVINGRDLVPFFAGLTPGFVGLYQVNVTVPTNLPPGIDQRVFLRVAGMESNLAFISIR